MLRTIENTFQLKWISKPGVAALMTVLLIAITACGPSTGSPVETRTASAAPDQTLPTAVVSEESVLARMPSETRMRPQEAGPHILATGKFDLPAASAFGDPGFHEELTASHAMTDNPKSSAGQRLVVRLWDARRSGVSCSREHPLSGCATVDWSDSPGRPNVPTSGVFENSVTLLLSSGKRTFYLSESGDLTDSPDRYDPG